MTDASTDRIASLDTVRGIAVMGILAMNIVAFGMPFAAYMNPAAYGGAEGINLGSWLFNAVLIDGKMRGLFSILFGASTLLVIQKAEEAGRGGAGAHYRRMFFLLIFGLIHFYFIWFGDILSLYALCGLLLYAFRRKSPGALTGWAIGFLAASFILFSAMSLSAAMADDPSIPAEQREGMQEAKRQIELETGANSPKIAQDLEIYRGPYSGQVDLRVNEMRFFPFISLLTFGWETMGLMLIGMALFKTGYLTGAWEPARYRKWAAWCFGLGIPGAAVLAVVVMNSGFDAAIVFGSAVAWSMPFDILLAIGWAALVILWVKRGGDSPLRDRVAAAGRMAFTNYLMTSILMTAIFYGWGIGLFGDLNRISLWIPVLAMWGLMLAWSKPWLERHHYGPLEWLWRSLSRGSLQPLRKGIPAPAAV
jgi:uncharacterized protein